jgi:CBS domain-containing protein
LASNPALALAALRLCSVGDVMTSDPVCVRAYTSVEDAANLLLRRRLRRLPVVDADGRLLGLITRSNIIKAAWELRRPAIQA